MRSTKLLMLAFVMFGASYNATAQTAEEIVNKHLTAIGGEANWKKVNSIKMVGAINANGTEITMTQTVVNGKAMRQDITLMGMSGYQIVTNKEGWSYMPFQGQKTPEAMTADDVKEQQEELDIQGKLVDYKTKGSKIAFLGKDQVEGTECFKLKLTTKAGKEETMYFDAGSYYLIKTTQKVKADGKEMEVATSFSNYQKQPEGIVIPMSVNAQGGEVVFKSVEINKPVDDKIFKPSSN
ncbi:MAG: hypothetical protein WCG87_05420 [Bacteroidota bacterium]